MVAHAAQIGMITTLVTNGALLTHKRVDVLAEAGLASVYISIDAEAQYVTPASARRCEQAVASSVQAAFIESRFSYCTAWARSREYSSLEIAFEFFKRSSFSSSSATLKPTT
jgi:hypothetical protein